jgi:hypothetical protein
VGGDESERDGEPLPESVLEAADRLTRLARDATDECEAAAYREDRDALLADHGYEARVREDDEGDVLVCYPCEWLDDGVVRVEAIEDLSRGVEVPLSGPGNADDWETVAAHNHKVAEAVADRYGAPHGTTAAALADFASNHYVKPIEDLTADERREFREEYLPRNAWPTEAQRERAAESVRLALDVVADATDGDVDGPGPARDR